MKKPTKKKKPLSVISLMPTSFSLMEVGGHLTGELSLYALKTFPRTASGKGFKLLITAPDGSKHTFIETAREIVVRNIRRTR